MVFSSLTFLFIFFPIVYIGNRLIPKKYINVFLLLMSLIFYAWGEPKYIILMLISIGVNYIFGILMEDYERYKKILLIVDVIFNIGLLGYFKYFDFFIYILNAVFKGNIPAKNIPLPIGISFYTFQILSYIIDLYYGKYKAQRSIKDLALYICLFPQLIAGPIVRYEDVCRQLTDRTVTNEKTVEGIKRFIYGLSKKVILANTLAECLKDIYEIEFDSLPCSVAWIGMITCMLNLYFDFSGYSDMAIGLGKMLGFDFCENFDLPYLSRTISEFWRRWHISLGTWFRKYVYIPLGGNRKGEVRTYINYFIVFALTGLWHGAAFGYVAWGVWNGILIIAERGFLLKWLEKHPFIGRIYTLIATGMGMIIFDDGLSKGIRFIKVMLTPFSKPSNNIYNFSEIVDHRMIFVLIIGILVSGYGKEIAEKLKLKAVKLSGTVELSMCMVLFIISIILLAGNTYNPFIYFRF